jgi:hypothetical protein
MLPNNQFNGLSMPVFTAFGWAGEENAIKFALAQLEAFIEALFNSVPRDVQAQFPKYGLDPATQSVYMGSGDSPQEGMTLAFYARPLSLEISLNINDKATLSKAYRAAEVQPETLFNLLSQLGPEWSLRIQQMQLDEETRTASHYQDLYKDAILKLDPETMKAIVQRAAYLNREGPWLVPIYISRRLEAEKAAVMGQQLLRVVGTDINSLMPVVRYLTGQSRRSKPKARASTKSLSAAAAAEKSTAIYHAEHASSLEQFTYISELKPLHLRRGYVDLTPNHWSFFAQNVRTETRPVTIHYGSQVDQKSSVWRLVPSDIARLVLSPAVGRWLEENFQPNDHIQVMASKPEAETIHVTLKAVE